MTVHEWSSEYDRTAAELRDAEALYRHTKTAFDLASARYETLSRKLSDLFHERCRQINDGDGEGLRL